MIGAPGILLLADSRLPSGAHAHSGGVEMAVDTGSLSTVDDLVLFLRGRLRTAGPMLATSAAAACSLAGIADVAWSPWDDAISVRTPAPALRDASRAQGAALLRTARRIWSSPALSALQRLDRPHLPLVVGAAVAAAAGEPADAAALALHQVIGGACSAAVRLLGLDPIDVAAAHAGLADLAGHLAATATTVAATAVAHRDPALLPATGAPLVDVLAQHHAHREVTLFAS